MGAEETTAATPATPAASDAGGAVPTTGEPGDGGAPEPTEAPAAAETTEAPAAFPDAAAFDWDAWDGSTDGLPEEVLPWHERFAERHQTALDKATADAERYQNLWESAVYGQEDPRVAEAIEAKEALQKEWDAAKAKWETDQQTYDAAIKDSYDLYTQMVGQVYKDTIEALSPEEIEGVKGLIDKGFAVHEVLDVLTQVPGSLKQLAELAEQGATPKLAARILRAEASEKKAPKREPSKAASAMAGAEPAQRPAPTKPVDVGGLTGKDATMAAVREAMRLHGGFRKRA